MAGWVLWLIVACVLGFGEALTGRAFLMSWAIGAALAAIVDAAAVGGFVPWLVFVIGSALARPLVAVLGRSRSRREVSRPIPPEPMVGKPEPMVGKPEPMVGKQGVVREQIANRYGVGCIELEGEIWTARSFDRDRVIDPGVEVTVVEVRGGTALVSD